MTFEKYKKWKFWLSPIFWVLVIAALIIAYYAYIPFQVWMQNTFGTGISAISGVITLVGENPIWQTYIAPYAFWVSGLFWLSLAYVGFIVWKWKKSLTIGKRQLDGFIQQPTYIPPQPVYPIPTPEPEVKKEQ